MNTRRISALLLAFVALVALLTARPSVPEAQTRRFPVYATSVTTLTSTGRSLAVASSASSALTTLGAVPTTRTVGGLDLSADRSASALLAALYPATTVSLASSSGWTTRNGEGGSGTSSVNTGTESLDFTCTSAGSQVYTTIGRAPPASPPIFDLRSRISAFSSSSSGDSLSMGVGDALASSIYLNVSITGNDNCSAFSSSGNPGSTVSVVGAGDGQGWFRLVVIAGQQAAAYIGIGSAGAEPTTWTPVGYVQLAAGGRSAWPFIVWQLNRSGVSGNVTASVTSIRYYSHP